MQDLTLDACIRLVRLLIGNGIARDAAIANPAIPEALREAVASTLDREESIILRPATVISTDPYRRDWLQGEDRNGWYYWPTLRDYLLTTKDWPSASVRSLDEITNSILMQLAPPKEERFNIRGLVVGYVQSGKTANFTALIAKAADVGYRLVVVLSGLDNGLRRQTQLRLNKELVGFAEPRPDAVPLPPVGRQWHQFTTEEMHGDFHVGNANHSALQGSQPVLLVVKKNGAVLRRLLAWIDGAPDEARRSLAMLVVDDEADQASVDTRGTYQVSELDPEDEYTPPAIINGLIRALLRRFQRSAYVAYTATPFANVLIPHDAIDPDAGEDLYPKDFIVDLPMPDGYFGAEKLFGRQNSSTGERIDGMDVVRHIPDADVALTETGQLPASLKTAIMDFVLAGAARAERGQGGKPATMLIHTSQLTEEHRLLWAPVNSWFQEFKDEWRYHRGHEIRDRLRKRWEDEFVPVTRAAFISRVRTFEEIEDHIGPFLESLAQPKQVNSVTGEMLDYERNPGLKAIAIGGNRLARGLTLEGLLVSYFVRSAAQYDTLMQMGRWFGFRAGYEDLTRIWTTAELAGWFADLATVEHELRQDVRRYEAEGVNPKQLGTRIKEHPSMLVTSRLKQRYATRITVNQSYSGQVVQTVRFPFSRRDDLALMLEENLQVVKRFLPSLGQETDRAAGDVLWTGRATTEILGFLSQYKVDEKVRNVSLSLVCSYIEFQVAQNELVRWTVAVKGQARTVRELGRTNWSIPGGEVNMISRSRLKSDPDSIGVLTSPGDELLGFNEDQRAEANAISKSEQIGLNVAARSVRSIQEGLLIIYPVSRHSGGESSNRIPLFEDPTDGGARDLVGVAVSFPKSPTARSVSGYLVGSAGWRPT